MQAAPRGKIGRIFGQFFLVFSACIAAVLAIGLATVLLLGTDVLGGKTEAEAWSPEIGCNVVGIAVRGAITVSPLSLTAEDCLYGCPAVTASDDVIEYLRTAGEDTSIKAILLDVDSPGGEPVASEEIARAVRDTGKPSVAWVRQTAASGAYWVASAAGKIVASANSDVGSIGVSMSYLDNVDMNDEQGLHFNSLSTGKYKDMGSPDQILTEEEIALIERDLFVTHENFVAAIAANRNLSYETVAALADGSTMLGKMALENGLIDMIGGQKEAYDILREAIGEEPVICWGGL